MAVIKNKKTGMWEMRTYYKDLTGERKQKTAYEISPRLVGSEMCIRDS